jgi:hypothetical protein
MDQQIWRWLGVQRLARVVGGSLLGALLAWSGGAALAPQSGAGDLAAAAPAAQAEWLGLGLTDARTGQDFTLRDYQGQVVLLQPMAVW